MKRTSKVLIFNLRALVIAAIALLVVSATYSQTFTPLGYWQFEAGSPFADNSGNAILYPISINTSALTLSNAHPIVGDYYRAVDLPMTRPAVSHDLDITSANFEVGLEFWIRVRQGQRTGSVFWANKCQLSFTDQAISWEVRTAGGDKVLNVNLRGVGAADPYQLLNHEWHHIVAQYSSKTGEQRIYIDGVCPPGFRVNHGVGAAIRDGGVLDFTYAGGVDHLVADLDEFAAYDTLIPPQLVWEHYQQGLAGNHYNFTVQSPVATYPFPGPVQEGEINLMEFAPGYPNVPLSALTLFNTYPLPRYDPNDSILPIIPFMADDPPFFDNVSRIQSNIEARGILENLAKEWNYFLFGGGALMGYLHIRDSLGATSQYMHHALASMNANPILPRFMVSNWNHTSAHYLFPLRDTATAILGQNMPNNFYIRDASGVPALDGFGIRRKNFAMAANPADPRMDSIDLDGRVNRFFFNTVMQHLADKHLEMIGENDEAIGVLDPAFIRQDWEIRLDSANNFPNVVSKEYQSERLTQFRYRYRDKWINYLDTLIQGTTRPLANVMWYDLAGDVGYGRQHGIVRYSDGLKRASPHIYPQAPHFWRHGYLSLHAYDQTCNSLFYQLQAGDKIFNPAVSPGFNDGGFWTIGDSSMLRPGQFLGFLKGLMNMGADSYAMFMYQVGSAAPSVGNWRTWHMPMASYAQGITSRVQEYMYNGEVLVGDTTMLYGGWIPSAYTFSTGNPNDLITGRKLPGPHRYLISASAQRTGNQQSQAPKARVVSFRLHDNTGHTPFDSLKIEERLQGSTYILDRSNAAAPVFYQLDKWHEWKEPGHWCRDFDFEAEVWDSAQGAPAIITERPVPVTSGDFTEFTTFVRQSSNNGWTEYRFRPTGSDQDTLYLWLHARTNSTFSAQDVDVTVDGGNLQSVRVNPVSGFGWHGRDGAGLRVQFGPLGMSEHILRVRTGTFVDIDRLVLLRDSVGDTATWGLEADILLPPSDTLVCFGDTASFFAKIGSFAGCFEHFWDFGDGTNSSGGIAAMAQSVGNNSIGDMVRHYYQYPGIYKVILSVSNYLTDENLRDSIYIRVQAPFVDAGIDHLACLGDSLQLDGDAQPVFGWLPDTALASTTILDPYALADTSHYFYLNAVDSAGCQMTDSTWMTVIGLPYVAEDTLYRCPGDTVHLIVHGAFWVEWAPDTTLSDLHIPGPIASPIGTTTYSFTAIDICRCDTVFGTVTIVVEGATTADTTICLGGTAELHAAGAGPFVWNPGGSTNSVLIVSPTVMTTYTLQTIDTTLGCREVRVIPLPYVCCAPPTVSQDWYKVRTSTLPQNAFTGGTWHIYDTLFVDVPTTFTNTNFLMQPYSVIYVLPGVTFTTNGCTFKAECPTMWSGIRLDASATRWNSSGDYVTSAIRGVWSTSGAAIDLNGSVFDGCWTGVYIDGGVATNYRRIEGCKFLGNVQLLAPFSNQRKPWAGVQINGATGFVVGVAGGGVNRYDLLQHGVYCRDARVAVYNGKFTNMVASSSAPTVAPWSLLGLGMGAGVWSKAGTASLGLTVGNANGTTPQALAPYANTFTACRYGVYTQGTHALRVRGNTFDRNVQGVRMGAATNNFVYVEYNKHADDGTAIWVGNMPNNNSVYTNNITGRIAENTITSSNAGLHHGIRCDLLTYPTLAGNYPFQVLHNTLNLRGNGIWVQTSTRINIQDNFVTLSPMPGDSMRGITINSGSRNRVNLNQVTSNTVSISDTLIVGVYVQNSGASIVTCNTTMRLPRHFVFHGNCLGSDFLRNTMQSPGGVATLPAGVDGLVCKINGAIGTQGTTSSPSDNRWIGVFSVSHTHAVSSVGSASRPWTRWTGSYRPTLFATTGAAFPIFPQQVTSIPAIPQSCGTMNIVASKEAAILEVANAVVPLTKIDSAMKYRADEWAYEELLDDSILRDTSILMQAYYNDIDSTLLGAVSRANVDLTEPDTIGAIIEVALVSPLNDILSLHKDVQEIRIADEEIDSLELAQLISIARQCEDFGGKAVNFARSMLATEGLFIWNDPACYQSTPPVKKQDIAVVPSAPVVVAECWPNPTSGELNIKFNQVDLIGTLRVFDAHGKVLLTRQFDYGGVDIPVDASGWSQGLLLVQVELEDGLLFSWRIVLER